MENIEREVLQKGGFLYEEPVFLLEKEVKELVSYFSIMKNIAAEKIVELSEYEKVYSKFSKSGFTNRLRELAGQSSSVMLINRDSVI